MAIYLEKQHKIEFKVWFHSSIISLQCIIHTAFIIFRITLEQIKQAQDLKSLL